MVKNTLNVNVINESLIFQFQKLINGVHPLLRRDVVKALDLSHKLLISPLSEEDFPAILSGAWAFAIFLFIEYLNPNINTEFAIHIAIAGECWFTALDFIDDLQDEDTTPVIQELGHNRVQSVILTLQLLAQKAILQNDVSQDIKIRLLQILLNKTLASVNGQHLDVLFESYKADAVSLEESLEIVANKSGSLLSLALGFAAVTAGASEKLQKQIEEVSVLIGIYHQLMNDCTDFLRPDKTDVRRGKKTVPAILVSQYGEQKGLVSAKAMTLLYQERVLKKVALLEKCVGRPLPLLLRHLLGIGNDEKLNH